MRILVTGGAGYVGGFAARHLMAVGHTVVALDDLRAGHAAALPASPLIVGDIADTSLVGSLLREHRIDAVMHFAASTSVGESVEDPGLHYRNNTVNTLGLLETMMEHDVRRIVFSSTAATYGENDVMPLREDSPTRPSCPYGTSKLVIESMIRDFAHAHGLAYGILRYFNAAGAATDGSHGEDHTPETHLIPLIMQAILGLRPALKVFGDDWDTRDGTCVRDYVHVEDLALAHQLVVEALPKPEAGRADSGRIYNVGTGHGATVMEVIRAAEAVSGRSVPREVTGRRPGDPASLVASSERLRTELGWKPRHETIDSIVATAWEWHLHHPKGYADSNEVPSETGSSGPG